MLKPYRLVVALTLVLAVGACSTTHHRTIIDHTLPTLRAYNDGHGLSFVYPARWNVVTPGAIAGVGGRTYPIACLSNVKLAACPSPDFRLPRDGVYVSWYAVETNVSPGVASTALMAGSCSGTGAEGSASQTWHVAWNDHVNRTVFALACWRGPDTTIRGGVQAIIDGARVVSEAEASRGAGGASAG